MEKKRPLTEKHISKEEAIKALMDAWKPEIRTEEIELIDADGRTLAEDLYAKYDQPVYRASRMDGIAVDSARFADGIPDTSEWKLGTDYVRADTGDDFPDEFDTVIPIEEVDIDENGKIIYISEDLRIKEGDSVRPRGSQIMEGDLLLEKDRIIRPVDLVSLAMGGISMVSVRKTSYELRRNTKKISSW